LRTPDLWDVVEWELRALHQLQDAILSIWANISRECFQHLVESMPRRIKTVLQPKEYGVPNNPFGERVYSQ